MPAKKHDVFKEPEDLNAVLWRYMDFTKFISLLDSKALYFANSTLLGDPFEGSLTNVNVSTRSTLYSDDPFLEERLPEIREELKRYHFINCWHQNPRESAAMWKLYAQTTEAIAIKTTYSKLFDALDERCHVGEVNYVDYDIAHIPEGNPFGPFLYKRDSFKHEEEVRAIINDMSSAKNIVDGEEHYEIDFSKESPRGILVPVALSSLIVEVYIAPTAPNWFADLVKSVCALYELKAPIISSKLDARPIY